MLVYLLVIDESMNRWTQSINVGNEGAQSHFVRSKCPALSISVYLILIAKADVTFRKRIAFCRSTNCVTSFLVTYHMSHVTSIISSNSHNTYNIIHMYIHIMRLFTNTHASVHANVTFRISFSVARLFQTSIYVHNL